jgi:hypothetical protein
MPANTDSALLLRALILLMAWAWLSTAYTQDAHEGHSPHAAAAPQPAAAAALPQTAPAAVPAPQSDIRVVIDTSGSMKQTDPSNLRIPALKLLINLLPDGARAGLWLFDSEPVELLPVGAIDQAWRGQAVAAAAKIHSKGRFTHIEAALVSPAKEWAEPPASGVERSVILLTDGKVDISKKIEDNTASRERIATEVLPWLQHLGVKIHTIALSNQSDQELLKQISLLTGGWSEVAEDAEQLQRVFVQMFNKTTPHDSVPLQDNHFDIDPSIQEFTALVLLRPDAKPTQLIPPKGEAITQGRAPQDAVWRHEAGYDLITLSHPSPGQWKLQADIDPASQVLVVTHLKMEVSPMDSYLSKESLPDIAVSFQENGQPVTREDFLKLLAVSAELSWGHEKKQLPMPMDLINPGQFVLNLEDAHLAPGDYSLKINADGKTFKREATLSFKILDELVSLATARNEQGEYLLTLTPTGQAPAAAQLVIQAMLTDSANQKRELPAATIEHGWRVTVPAPGPEDHWILNLTVTAKTPDGKTIATPLKPLHLEGAAKAAPPPESHAPPADEPHAAPSPEAAAPSAKPNWMMTAGVAAGVNLVILAGGFMGYRLIKKRSEAAIAKLLNNLS